MSEETEQVEGSTEQEDVAAFEAGFSEARGDESPISETTEEVSTTEPEPAAEPEPTPEPEPEPEIVLAGMTEEQLKSVLAKAGEVDDLKSQVRNLFGRLGEVNGRLQQQAQVANQTRRIGADQLQRLRASYPDLADDLAEDLSNIALGGGQTVQEFDSSALKQEFSQELERIKQANEAKLLSIKHRDWVDVRASDDFKLWEQTLPTEVYHELNNSWDAVYLADKFDEFKEWRAKAIESKNQKRDRLSAAITPTRGNARSTHTVADDDAFLAGFKAVRG
jgi:hypothetical protein